MKYKGTKFKMKKIKGETQKQNRERKRKLWLRAKRLNWLAFERNYAIYKKPKRSKKK